MMPGKQLRLQILLAIISNMNTIEYNLTEKVNRIKHTGRETWKPKLSVKLNIKDATNVRNIFETIIGETKANFYFKSKLDCCLYG